MISLKSEFNFIERGFKGTIVLLYGWATDLRIFSTLNLDYNYLLPAKLDPFGFEKDLLIELKKRSLEKVCLFGWSLGSFVAAEFALKNPQRLKRLILVSISAKFNQQVLKDIELKIKKNKAAYLYKFYLDCFSGRGKEGFGWFKKNLLKKYTSEMNLEGLLYGLDYLSQASLAPEQLSALEKIRVFHGREDEITPFKEAKKLSRSAGAKLISLENCGHIPFLRPDFRDIFYHGQKKHN